MQKAKGWLYELRSVGDYGMILHVPQKDAEQAIDAAKSFVKDIKKMIDLP